MVDMKIYGEDEVDYKRRTKRRKNFPYRLCSKINEKWSYPRVKDWRPYARYRTRKARDEALRCLNKTGHWYGLYEFEAYEIVFPDEYQLGIVSSD